MSVYLGMSIVNNSPELTGEQADLDAWRRAERRVGFCKIKSSRDSHGGKYVVTVTQYVHDVTLGKDAVWSVRRPGYLRRLNDDRADWDKRIWSARYESDGQELNLGDFHYGRSSAEFAVAVQMMRDEERRVADELKIAALFAEVLYPNMALAELRDLRDELLSGECSPAVAEVVGSEIIADMTGVLPSR